MRDLVSLGFLAIVSTSGLRITLKVKMAPAEWRRETGSVGGTVRDVVSLGVVVVATFGVLLSPWLLAFGPEGALQVGAILSSIGAISYSCCKSSSLKHVRQKQPASFRAF